MRIARYLSICGLGSRRACESFIKNGRVRVNGEIVTNLTTRIDAEKDEIVVDGKSVKPCEIVYYLLNKPPGYTCSRSDAYATNLVTELVPDDPPVWPAGRLDRETTGLLILTNDGKLTQRLTHPRHKKSKEYVLETEPPFSAKDIDDISKGIVLTDGLIIPDKFDELRPGRYKIVIHEGRKRIIRRLA
ncbi:MAG: pseudouridine synthase, partial [Actinomycetota bacterium]